MTTKIITIETSASVQYDPQSSEFKETLQELKILWGSHVTEDTLVEYLSEAVIRFGWDTELGSVRKYGHASMPSTTGVTIDIKTQVLTDKIS